MTHTPARSFRINGLPADKFFTHYYAIEHHDGIHLIGEAGNVEPTGPTTSRAYVAEWQFDPKSRHVDRNSLCHHHHTSVEPPFFLIDKSELSGPLPDSM